VEEIASSGGGWGQSKTLEEAIGSGGGRRLRRQYEALEAAGSFRDEELRADF
jgi:hypothetical protein